jgi:arginine decarboxylase
VQEAARVYARLYKRDVPLRYLDIGGGLAVDYDGSQSQKHSSMNYTMADYASGVVFEIKQICDVEEVPHPTLVSESGRAITAHHSCVVMQAIGEVSNGANPVSTEPVEDEHILVTNMHSLLASLGDKKNHQDIYNDASLLLADILSAFKLGILGLEELARSETLHWRIMNAIARELEPDERGSEDLLELQSTTTSQYLCNFSLFQSAADIWAIQQILPLVPIARLNEEPTQNCTLADITCDSDGRIVDFIGAHAKNSTLPLHQLIAGEPYYIGMFLTGAYQDVMGDTHNLFGRVNEVHVFCDTQEPGGFYIEEYVPGSTASQVLGVMQYNPPAMAAGVKALIDKEVAAGNMGSREGVKLI